MSVEAAVFTVLAAVALDFSLGDPPSRYHPTAWAGWLYARMVPPLRAGRRRADLMAGTAIVVSVCAAAALLLSAYVAALGAIDDALGPVMAAVIAAASGAILLKSAIAIRGMERHAMAVAESLEAGTDGEARGRLAMIVKRRTGGLDHPHIISATIESVAENIPDGATGPLFYYALFGLPGAIIHRLVSTADSMIGYKTAMFADIGWFAAKCDTILNYAPARITVLCMAAAAGLLGMDSRRCLSAAYRLGRTVPGSSACTMAAAAGALHIRLDKPGHYCMDGGDDPLDVRHIRQAVKLMKLSCMIFCLGFAVPTVVLLGNIGWFVHA